MEVRKVRRITSMCAMALAVVTVSSCGGPGAEQETGAPTLAVTSHGNVDVTWESEWDAAFQRARAEGKPVMANFYAEWCVWCKHLETVTFRDRKVATMIADTLVPVNIDIDGDVKDLVRDQKIQAPPTIVLYTAEGEELGRIPGYLPPGNFLTVVEKILNGETVTFS